MSKKFVTNLSNEEHSRAASSPSFGIRATKLAPPTVSVAICTRERPSHLDACLDALRDLRYPNCEIVVVNNGPQESPTKEIAESYQARYVYVPDPGLSRARNVAAETSGAEIIAYLDDDSIPNPDWLDHLVQEFSDPDVMIVTGRVDPVSLQSEAERIWDQLSPSPADRARRVVLSKSEPEWFEIASFGGVGIGCNMAVRRSAWTVWPGFDERLGRGAAIDGGEENMAFVSLVDRGYHIVYTPDAIVRHAAPDTMGALRRRYVTDLAVATAYMSLLFVEYPRYRRPLLRFLSERLHKTPRTWKERRPHPTGLAPRWRKLFALMSGPFVYLKARFTATSRAK